MIHTVKSFNAGTLSANLAGRNQLSFQVTFTVKDANVIRRTHTN